MRKLLLAAIAVLSVAVPSTASAQSSIPNIGYARVLGPIHSSNGGTAARLHVRYSCSSGDHLWVSVKQSATGAVDPAIEGEGSGGNHVSATWLDSHRNATVCDGDVHQGWFDVDQLEGPPDGPAKYGALVPGQAFIQFCVTDTTITENFGLTTYLSDWVKVV